MELFQQRRLQRLEPEQQASRSRLVGGIGWRDLHRQQQPERIDQHMLFPALDLFASIIVLGAARTKQARHSPSVLVSTEWPFGRQ